MQMGMMPQGLAPGVQYCQEANLGPEVFGIRGDRAQRFGGGGEENVVDDAPDSARPGPRVAPAT